MPREKIPVRNTVRDERLAIRKGNDFAKAIICASLSSTSLSRRDFRSV